MIVMRRISLSLGIAATALMLCVTPAHADESAEIDKLLRQGQTAQALQRANQWLTQHPKDLKVRFRKGVILADQGRLNEAILQFAELSRDHPNLAEARNNLAVLYAARGEFDKAQRELEQAIASHPAYATAHRNLGDLYERMAKQAYDKALNLNKTAPSATENNLSRLALMRGLASESNPPQIARLAAATPTPAATPPANKTVVTPPPTTTPSTTVNNLAPLLKSPPAPPATAKTEAPAVKAEPAKTEAAKVEPKPAAATAVKPSAEPATPPVNAAQQAEEQAAIAALKAWADAWAAKDVNRYLTFYAPAFRTPKGESRSAWEASRRVRIDKPGQIEVEILQPVAKTIAKDQVEIRFRQRYRSSTFSANSAKSVLMTRQAGKWQILEESVGR